MANAILIQFRLRISANFFWWGGGRGTDATRELLRLQLHQIETGAGIVARCTWHCSAARCAQLLSLSCICSGSSEGGRWSASGALGAGSRSPQPAPLLGGCACNWSTSVWQITPWHRRTVKYINKSLDIGEFTLIKRTWPSLTILTCLT